MRDSGCALVAALVFAVVVAAVLFGAPIISGGGLTWDNSATLARIQSHERLERDRIAANVAEGERWHDTLRWLIVGAGTVFSLRFAVAGLRSLIDYWRHRNDNLTRVQLAALPILAQRPGSRLERIALDGKPERWYVVDDKAKQVVDIDHLLPG